MQQQVSKEFKIDARAWYLPGILFSNGCAFDFE